jgi:hypothetical protein
MIGLSTFQEIGVCDYPYNVDCRGTPVGVPAVSQVTTVAQNPTSGLNTGNYSGQYEFWLKKVPASESHAMRNNFVHVSSIAFVTHTAES